jgi:hypothetical protein
VENNQNSHRARHAHTNKLQQKHAFGIPLRPKAAGEAIRKGKNRNTEKEGFSHCSK